MRTTSLVFTLYNFLFVPLLKLTFIIGAPFNKKLKQGLKGRDNYFPKLTEALSPYVNRTKRILIHASSVGEWEQAVPLIDLIKKEDPSALIVVTFFSPSGFNFVKNYANIDVKCYLPIDTRSNAFKLFNVVKPTLWIISKFDIWPNHLRVAHAMNIKIVITAATLSSNSKRTKGIHGILSKECYKTIDHIFAISMIDAQRFYKLIGDNNKISITGDTRFDRVYEKAMQSRKLPDVQIFQSQPTVSIIAASIWPADEKIVLPALSKLMHEFPQLKLILVPHELHETHIKALEKHFEIEKHKTERYSSFKNIGGTTNRIAIVDTVGLLARIYRQTNLAYVGGSFSTGVHNVMEPAIFEQPVIFGPVYQNSFEAMQLIEKNLAQSIQNTSECYTQLKQLIENATERESKGKASAEFIKSNLGAAQITFNALKTKLFL